MFQHQHPLIHRLHRQYLLFPLQGLDFGYNYHQYHLLQHLQHLGQHRFQYIHRRHLHRHESRLILKW